MDKWGWNLMRVISFKFRGEIIVRRLIVAAGQPTASLKQKSRGYHWTKRKVLLRV